MSVPTKSFKQLLDSIAKRLSFYAEDGTIAAKVTISLTDLINSATRSAWLFYAWPDSLIITEEDVIAHPTATGARYVPRQSAARTLHTIFRVWDKDPRQDSSPMQGSVSHKVLSDGIYIFDASVSTVWVYHRPAPPEYDHRAWVTATAYAVGDLRLHSDGHVYRCLIAHNSVVFADDLAANKWVVVTVLEVLFEAIKQGVISHYKRYQSGQPVTAKTFEELMLTDLESEIAKLRTEDQDP